MSEAVINKVLPPGKYVISDLCYVMPNDQYHRWLHDDWDWDDD